MKIARVISTATLLLLLGTTVPAFAQQEQHEQEGKSEKQGQAKPERQQQQAKPARQEQQAKPEQRQEQPKSAKQQTQAKPAQQREQAKPEQRQEQAKSAKPQTQPAKQEERGKVAGRQPAQRNSAEEQRQRSEPALRLSSRSNFRIPDARFHSSFGRDHRFHIGSPTLVGGYSRFQYGGFWFGFLEPWPSGWNYTDDVYVDYVDGGYFLYNPSYPGARIAITVYVD